MAKTRAPNLLVLACGLMFISQLANYVLAPAFPQLPEEFGVSIASVQRLLGVFLAGFALVQLFIGPLSDRFGRRPIVVASLILFLIGTAICAVAPTLETLAVGLLIQAMGAGSFPTLAQALLRDQYELREVVGVLSLLSTVMAVTVALTPLISSVVLAGLGWRAMFYGLFVIVAPLAVLIPLILPETLSKDKRTSLAPGAVARAYGGVLSNRPFMAFSLSLGLMTGAMAAFFAGAPFVILADFGYTLIQFGWWFLGAFSGFVFGTLIGGRLVANFGFGMRATALSGVSLACIGSIAGFVMSRLLPESMIVVLACAFVFSLGLGIALGVGRGAAMLRVGRNVGAASATINFMIAGLAAVIAGLAPMFDTHDHAGLFQVTALVAALAVIAVLLAGPDPKPEAAEPAQ